MSVKEILRAHPRAPVVELEVLVRCIDECRACTVCADACLGEEEVRAHVRCVRLCLDCADACGYAGNVLSRATDPDRSIQLTALEAYRSACRACAEECERHAPHAEHCRLCAEECRRCESACTELSAALDAWRREPRVQPSTGGSK
jgi:hypothetical protein